VVRKEQKPTACTRWKAGVRDALRRAFRTPPGSETRAWSHRGSLETWESQWFPCRASGGGVPTIEGKTPGAGGRLSPPRRALQGQGTHSKTSATRYRGRGEGEPHDPETGHWQSSRTIVPRAGSPVLLVGKVGNHRPRDPLQGRRSRAARFSGRTAGRDSGLTNRLQDTPETCPAGQALSGHGVQQRVALD
jgi:hypothetical protein